MSKKLSVLTLVDLSIYVVDMGRLRSWRCIRPFFAEKESNCFVMDTEGRGGRGRRPPDAGLRRYTI